MIILLDTSAIVSFFVEDAHTEKANKIFGELFVGKLTAYAPSFVIIELCGAISRKTGRQDAALAFRQVNEWVKKNIIVLLDQTDETFSIACRFAINYGIKGSDALISALSRQHRIKLATFDEEITAKLKSEIEFYQT